MDDRQLLEDLFAYVYWASLDKRNRNEREAYKLRVRIERHSEEMEGYGFGV